MQCANCEKSHSTNSNWCILRHKTKINIYKKKTLGKNKAKIIKTNDEQNKAYSKISLSLKVGMDLEAKKWIENKKKKKTIVKIKSLKE